MVRTKELQAKRKLKGATQADAAEAIHCSVNTYCSKENNERPFTIDEVVALCSFLGIDSDLDKAYIFLYKSSQ